MNRPFVQEAMNTNNLLDNAYRSTRYLAIALLGSLFIEAGVVELVHWTMTPFDGFGEFEGGSYPLMRYLLVLVGMSDLIILPFLRRSILLAPAKAGEETPALLARLRNATILTLAISNAPAILGLAIFLI
ncbi:MAG: hypothetical protein HC806_07400, partial [Anaerolineae bacterium]|nr:hypothetical protein [Anaerolineae bacterium]